MATEILNNAIFYDRYEIIKGEKFMAPSADIGHNNIVGKSTIIIGMHVTTRVCC